MSKILDSVASETETQQQSVKATLRGRLAEDYAARTAADWQTELAEGDDRPVLAHVVMALDTLLAEGLLVADGVGDARTYRARPEPAVDRRVAIIRALVSDDGLRVDASPRERLAVAAGRPDDDLLTEDLAALGAYLASSGKSIRLAPVGVERLLSAGAQAMALDTATRDGRTTYQVAEEELRLVRTELGETRRKLAACVAWLAARGVVAAPLWGEETKAPGPRRASFVWEKRVELRAPEEIAALFKDLRLQRERIVLADLAKAAATAAHKAETEEATGEIRLLEAAGTDGVRVLAVEAYVEPDWSEGVEVVRAVEDDRVLETRPIARGTQRPLVVAYTKATLSSEGGGPLAKKPKPKKPSKPKPSEDAP